MEELINALTDIIYAIKYGSMKNGKKNYKKLMFSSQQLKNAEDLFFKDDIMAELSNLKISFYSPGAPKYIYLEPQKKRIKVYIINDKYQFLCRLRDREINQYRLDCKSYYII